MKRSINDAWEYSSEVTGGAWERVLLPHTPRLEALDVGYPFQGVAHYRRQIPYEAAFEGKRLYVDFEAVMQVATVCMNGTELCVHKGGYLPFRVDITDYVKKDGQNILEVYADNRDNRDVPPGKVSNLLDFSYPGGIYRSVWLSVDDPLHITDEVAANIPRGGGVFVSYSQVSEAYAEVLVRVTVENCEGLDRTCHMSVSLSDADGDEVVEGHYGVRVSARGSEIAEWKLGVRSPHLWGVDDPYLYTLTVRVTDEERLLDERTRRIGIRAVSADLERGLLLNGKPVRLIGANRHQSYPHVGGAAHENAQWRDAYKLKQGGFNFVRLAHYPQSSAFLDACDELGLLVMEPTPGWQWCREGEFCELVLQNIRDMVRRDRHHPSVILWETSLNETGDTRETMWHELWSGNTDDFARLCRRTAEEEYERGNFLTAGDTVGRHNPNSIGYDIPFVGLTAQGAVVQTAKTAAELEREGKFLVFDRPTIRREYGDFEFGLHYSLSRQVRGVDECSRLLQAWNYIWTHNRSVLNDYHTVGNAIWVGIDYTRGYFPGANLCACGALDSYRLPKLTYHFFRSQQSERPVVFLANTWRDPTLNKVVVFSNCDEVALYLNGRLIERRRPDVGEFRPHGARDVRHPYLYESRPDLAAIQCDIGVAKATHDTDAIARIRERYMNDSFFDGANTEGLRHPVYTFRGLPSEAGELCAVGYRDGCEVARDVRRTPGAPVALRLRADESGRPLAAAGDFVFVYATVVDQTGEVVPEDGHVRFVLEGDGVLLTPPVQPIEDGIATAMVRTGVSGTPLTLRAAVTEGLCASAELILTPTAT